MPCIAFVSGIGLFLAFQAFVEADLALVEGDVYVEKAQSRIRNIDTARLAEMIESVSLLKPQ